MTRYLPTSHFEILASRRLGLDRCEFDIKISDGNISKCDLFQVIEKGTLWEWIVLDISGEGPILTILCMNWVTEDGAFVGQRTFSRVMKAEEKKRYSKHLKGA